jgi:hypothetical protein
MPDWRVEILEPTGRWFPITGKLSKAEADAKMKHMSVPWARIVKYRGRFRCLRYLLLRRPRKHIRNDSVARG